MDDDTGATGPEGGLAGERRRIERLVQDGRVTAAEGRRLLAALAGAPRPGLAAALLDPFRRLGGEPAALLGLATALASMAVSRRGVRFDGFLDLHLAKGTPGWGVVALDQVVAWLLPALLFLGASRLVRGGGRAVDFLGMVGLARVTLAVAAIALLLIAPDFGDATAGRPPPMTPRLALFLVFTIVCVVWNLALLYQGFRNASGLGGTKAKVAFVVTTVVAEIASKLVLAAAS